MLAVSSRHAAAVARLHDYNAARRHLVPDRHRIASSQLVLCGDFFQLPPVKLGQQPGVCFAFEAKCWSRLRTRSFVLRHAYRQREQPFLQLLQEVRYGQLSPASVQLLKQAGSRVLGEVEGEKGGVVGGTGGVADGVKPTRLYPTNRVVDAINERELGQLPGVALTVHAQDHGSSDSALRYIRTQSIDLGRPLISGISYLVRMSDRGCYVVMTRRLLQQSCIAPTVLEMKLGAQVMLLKNLDVLLPFLPCRSPPPPPPPPPPPRHAFSPFDQ